MSSWLLIAEFDDLETQCERDAELEFPNDEASLFFGEVTRHWCALPGKPSVDINYTSTKVEVCAGRLAHLEEPLRFLMTGTIPKRLELLRME